MESVPMLSPTEKSTLLEKFSPGEDWTHDAALSRTQAQHTTNELFQPLWKLYNYIQAYWASEILWIYAYILFAWGWNAFYPHAYSYISKLEQTGYVNIVIVFTLIWFCIS